MCLSLVINVTGLYLLGPAGWLHVTMTSSSNVL